MDVHKKEKKNMKIGTTSVQGGWEEGRKCSSEVWSVRETNSVKDSEKESKNGAH